MLYLYETVPAHCSWKVLLLLGTNPERLNRKNPRTCFVVVGLLVVGFLFSKTNSQHNAEESTDHEGWEADSRVNNRAGAHAGV